MRGQVRSQEPGMLESVVPTCTDDLSRALLMYDQSVDESLPMNDQGRCPPQQERYQGFQSLWL